MNWVSVAAPDKAMEVMVQLRYRSHPVPAQLIPIPAIDNDHLAGRPHRCRLQFKEKQFSIAPGQAAVFYHGDVVLAGGLIQH
jgi:tRNA-specific 2-thiouridylase